MRFKFKILLVMLSDALLEWHENVYSVELDEWVCCSGRQYEYPCGCMGTTHREQLAWLHLQQNLRVESK